MQIRAALSLATNLDRIDAELLLCHVLQITRATLTAHPELSLTPEQQLAWQKIIAQRSQGVPVAYLLGYKHFWQHSFMVNEHTLIPRPETELLVEVALQHIATHDVKSVLDLGTGSGVIALSIAAAHPELTVVATDRSLSALQVAAQNAQALKIANVVMLHGSWFAALVAADVAMKFDLIVSNPPYVRQYDHHLQQGDLRFEPLTALAAGPDGLDDIRHIIAHAREYLTEQGVLLLEHGYDQQPAIIQLLMQHGYLHVQGHRDLAGHCRAVSAFIVQDQ